MSIVWKLNAWKISDVCVPLLDEHCQRATFYGIAGKSKNTPEKMSNKDQLFGDDT